MCETVLSVLHVGTYECIIQSCPFLVSRTINSLFTHIHTHHCSQTHSIFPFKSVSRTLSPNAFLLIFYPYIPLSFLSPTQSALHPIPRPPYDHHQLTTFDHWREQGGADPKPFTHGPSTILPFSCPFFTACCPSFPSSSFTVSYPSPTLGSLTEY